MIDPDDAARTWGTLAPTTSEAARAFGLTAQENGLLINPGLPVSAEPLFAAAPLRQISTPLGPMVQFGTDGGTGLCVRPPRGPVWSVPDAPDGRVRYVNATTNAFTVFLWEVCRLRARLRDLDEDEGDRLIHALERQLPVIDASALEEPDHWWSVVFEQLRDGFL